MLSIRNEAVATISIRMVTVKKTGLKESGPAIAWSLGRIAALTTRIAQRRLVTRSDAANVDRSDGGLAPLPAMPAERPHERRGDERRDDRSSHHQRFINKPEPEEQECCRYEDAVHETGERISPVKPPDTVESQHDRDHDHQVPDLPEGRKGSQGDVQQVPNSNEHQRGHPDKKNP